MKIKIYILLLVVSTSLLFASDSIIKSLSAKSDGKVIKIEWQTASENGLQRFELERANPNQAYKYINSFNANGYASYYSYSDEDAYKGSTDLKVDRILGQTAYTYRLKIVKSDNSYYYTNGTTAVHSVSGLQKTWGMIKEMFR